MEVKFMHVIGFRTEDPKFPTANLLRGGKWLSEKKSRSCVNDVTLQLDKIHVIDAIDIGNSGSAFVSVEVSRIGLQSFETLLPSTEFMSARDSQTKKNWSCVKMFSQEDLTEGVREQKWDLVRVVCMQPFLVEEQFGLTFLKIFSVSEKTSQCYKSESPPPPWSLFAKVRNHSLVRVVPINRSEQMLQAAMEQQKTLKLDNSEFATNKKEDSHTSLKNNFQHHTNVSSEISTSSRKSALKSAKSQSLQQQTVNSNNSPSTTATTLRQSKLLPHASSSSPSISELSFSALSSCKSIEGSQHEVSSGCTDHEVQVVSPPPRLNKELSLQPSSTKCKRSRHHNNKQNKQVAVIRAKKKSPDKPVVHLVPDSDSDDAVIVNTDSDTSTVILPVKECRNIPSGVARGLSPLRVHIDFESDTETVIIPADFQRISPPRKIASDLPKSLPFQCNRNTRKAQRKQSSPCRKEFGLKKDVSLVSSSSKNSSRLEEIPSLDSEEETERERGSSGVKCPLCSVYFEASEIEQHAANCKMEEESGLQACPICLMKFPPSALPHHAYLCGETSA